MMFSSSKDHKNNVNSEADETTYLITEGITFFEKLKN